MRDLSLFIIIIGGILVGVRSSNSQGFGRSVVDEPVRMASESLVVKSYKEAESSTLSTTKGHGDRVEEYQVYQGVMGRPGIDFPVYPHIPATSFSCRGVKKSGYYADLETDCQVFHICDGNRKISFLCPNGTIFRQSHLICDWWFRVDCGKSIELYEESAEQLAADQKIYKARSEERERRRKLSKAVENGEELTSSEVYALDEPFHIKSRKPEQGRNNQNASRNTPSRNIEGRKAERHSKKVSDSGMTEKFPAYSREKQNGRGAEKTRTAKPTDQYSTPPSVVTPKVSFVDTTTLYITPNYKTRNLGQNSINFVNNKENIELAESGNVFNDLNNRNAENDRTRVDQTELHKNTAYNNHPVQQNIHGRAKVNQTFDFVNNFAYTQSAKTETSKGQTGSFTYTENKRNDEVNNRNSNFYHSQIDNANSQGINYNNERVEQTGRSNLEQKEDIQYTTEFYNYESKRTNPVERQDTVTPTLHTRNGQSSKYRSSTPLYEEQEKQFFAETASFASSRGGKSYADFQNQFNTFSKAPSTTNPYKTTFYTTSRRPETYSTTLSHSTGSQNNQDYFRTTTHRPVKQHSKKVTLYPSTSPHTAYSSAVPQTTYQPTVETTTRQYTIEDIYFTTSTPEKEVEILTETKVFVPQKISELQNNYTTTSSSNPEVHITLQELNINKNLGSAENKNKSYEDFVREGLEVPPSSGPNAIRSFALYFATTNGNVEESRTTVYLPTAEPDIITTLTPFEIKKKEVVKQVDELVQRSSTNVSEHAAKEELPKSLTSQVKNSYSALFPDRETENHTTTMADKVDVNPTVSFETTAFESYTEEPDKINKELAKNDLDGSQSRGLVEPDPHSDTDYSKVSPDLRELAQVFTKALSAYLDDPEAFRKVLSEIRPTEPSHSNSEHSGNTQDDDEVLDFSDVTKSTFKKKTTPSAFRETTTEYIEPSTINPNEIENFVLPVNETNWATNIELTAPFFESLDQSQSNYYTPPPYVGTTNAIAEEINHEFTTSYVTSNDTVDSYLPLKGSVDDSSIPRYGGFQNNTNPTTKYSPYGAELTSTTYLPYGADLTSTSNSVANIVDATTFNPNNVTSFFNHFSKNESEEGEIQLAKELNNLVLLQKFTTPRGGQKEVTTEPNLSTAAMGINQFQTVHLGNGEVLEKSVRAGKSLNFPEVTINSNAFEPDARDINLELSPPPSTPKGFLITYSLGQVASSEPATYLPKATAPTIQPTTYSPDRQTTYFDSEKYPTTTNAEFENFSERLERLSKSKSFTTPVLETTTSFAKSTESIEKLAQLQETLMFNSNNVTLQQRDQARISVEEMMDKMNMTDTTANTLMKVMEMAAKNETYRRLVLLLVNDKSGKNKTVEEARLSLLKALLTPVINPPRTAVPIHETARLAQTEPRRRSGTRRGKSIKSESVRTTTPLTTTQKRPTNSRRVKSGRGLARSESNYQSGLGNLGLIRRTIENSKSKQVRVNSLDDAILDSDSRAVELLRSLYSLAARWG